MAKTALKTSRHVDIPLSSLQAEEEAGGGNCYYYYVYRKKINPQTIQSTDDLPVPLRFRQMLKRSQSLTSTSAKASASTPMRNTDVPTRISDKGNTPLGNSLPNSAEGRNRERKKSVSLTNIYALRDSIDAVNGNDDASVLTEAKGNLSPRKFFPFSPRKGLRWSRHTTMIKNEMGHREKSIMTETETKMNNRGKLIEECIETTSLKDGTGDVTISSRTFIKEIHSSDEDVDGNDSRATSNSIIKATPKLKREEQREFLDDLIKAINNRRKQHGVPLLEMNPKLNALAEEWSIRLASLERMEHRENKEYGENIYCKTSSQPWFQIKGEEVVSNWYNEIADHNFDEEPSEGYLKSGHFSQLIWKDTTDVGAAFCRNKNGHMAFVVAYFYPKGNWIGEFQIQVPPANTPGYHKRNITSRSSSKFSSATTIHHHSRNTSSTNSFNKSVLLAHNEYRKMHGVQPLKLDPQLNRFAQEWALSLAEKDRLEHRLQCPYGENLYRKLSPNVKHSISGKEAVDSWYNEINAYQFGKEPKDLRAGHFSQVIWADSEKLGVGQAKSKRGTIYVVANYYPPGNYVGEFSNKVPPPI